MNQPSVQLKIELIYDHDCPNVDHARQVLARALQTTGIDAGWQEWERNDPGCPDYARSLGSPSILVNESDVSPAITNDSPCCRIYPENPEFRGCPGLEDVVAAITDA